MKYQCQNKDCGKVFLHPAKEVIYFRQHTEDNSFKDPELGEFKGWVTNPQKTVENTLCPFCHSLEYAEYVEPVIEQRTEAVLVVDLVTGENLALNKALAEGYEIVGRYAKQYTLEKKKVATA